MILSHLSESGDWVRTLAIAKAVVGLDATKKDVNPTLYSLEKEGLVERKEFKKNDWHWKLSSGETEDMVTKSPEVKIEVEEEKVRAESQQEIVSQSGEPFPLTEFRRLVGKGVQRKPLRGSNYAETLTCQITVFGFQSFKESKRPRVDPKSVEVQFRHLSGHISKLGTPKIIVKNGSLLGKNH